MPAVKRKPARRKNPSALPGLAKLAERYAVAGVAGSGVIVGLVMLVLWSGGYFAAFGRAADRALENAAIAAGFEIDRVLLVGAHQLAHAEVVEALGPTVGRSIFGLSLKEARTRIENLGWVRTASVTRLYPDTISVSIRERAPAAVWQIDGDLHLIDDAGAVIREVGAYEYSNLPLIVGAGAPEAAAGILKALGGEPELQERVLALIRVGERRWNLRLRNNIDIKLPEEGYAKAIDDLALLQAAQGALDQEIETIDLRDQERMVIEKRDEGATGTAD